MGTGLVVVGVCVVIAAAFLAATLVLSRTYDAGRRRGRSDVYTAVHQYIGPSDAQGIRDLVEERDREAFTPPDTSDIKGLM